MKDDNNVDNDKNNLSSRYDTENAKQKSSRLSHRNSNNLNLNLNNPVRTLSPINKSSNTNLVSEPQLLTETKFNPNQALADNHFGSNIELAKVENESNNENNRNNNQKDNNDYKAIEAIDIVSESPSQRSVNILETPDKIDSMTKFFQEIKKKYRERKLIRVNAFDIFKRNFMCCRNNPLFSKSSKDFAIDNAIDELDNFFEITKIMKNIREFQVLKTILLSKEQRSLFILPSLNVNLYEPQEIDNDANEEEQVLGVDLIEKFEELDYSNKVNRKIAKNFISSII